MRRAFRKAAWTLATGIGIATPGLGQTHVGPVLGPGETILRTEAVSGLTETEARFEEGEVELAFLADPMLFSYGLAGHLEGSGLEIRGFVPTKAVREQALRVAREHSRFLVVDKLKVLPSVSTHNAVDRPENIQRAAHELLAEAFPDCGKTMEVHCNARGHVTVTGHVGSQEDKVLVSRKLRQVPGCSCVVNELTVGEIAPEVRPPDRSVVVVPEEPPVTVKPAVRTHEPSVPVTPARPVVATPESRESLPPARPVVATPESRESLPPAQSLPRVYSGPGALAPPLPEEKSLPDLPPPQRVVPPPAPPSEVPQPPAKPETRKPATSIDRDRSYASVPPVSPALDVPPVSPAKAASAVKVPQIVVPSDPPVWKPSLPAIPPPLKAPAPGRKPAGGSEESDVTEGIITFGDETPSVAKATGASARPAAASPVKPTERTPTPTAPAPRRPAPTPAALAAPPAPPRPVLPSAVRLRERIQAVCGPAYEVKVTGKGNNEVQVDVIGPNQADGARLLNRIDPVVKSTEFSTLDITVDIVAKGPMK
jgi:hypothetical protein